MFIWLSLGLSCPEQPQNSLHPSYAPAEESYSVRTVIIIGNNNISAH